MIRRILSHFEICVDPGILICPVFSGQEEPDSLVGESVVCESWRVLLKSHSMWQIGPKGYHLSSNNQVKCQGCGADRCEFYNIRDARSLGTWMYNSKNNGTTIPLPIDPVSRSHLVDTIVLTSHRRRYSFRCWKTETSSSLE